MTETYASYSSLYDPETYTILEATEAALSEFRRRYPENAEKIRTDVNDSGDIEVTVIGHGNY